MWLFFLTHLFLLPAVHTRVCVRLCPEFFFPPTRMLVDLSPPPPSLQSICFFRSCRYFAGRNFLLTLALVISHCYSGARMCVRVHNLEGYFLCANVRFHRGCSSCLRSLCETDRRFFSFLNPSFFFPPSLSFMLLPWIAPPLPLVS